MASSNHPSIADPIGLRYRTNSHSRRFAGTRMLIVLAALVSAFLCISCADSGTDPDNPPSTLVDMVSIPGGTTMMGDVRGGANQPDELPVHQVTVHAFLMSRHEVTQELFLQVMGSNPSYSSGRLDLPVENVTWYEAVEFCNALSALEGLTPCYAGAEDTGITCDFAVNGYRLPTEAEWEYACRSGTATAYVSGDTEEDLGRVAWYAGNSDDRTHPVGSREANGFDLCDMHGNVAEWCWDWYDPSWYASTPAENPLGPSTGEARVQRGGSYYQFPFELRSAYRGNSQAPSRKGRDTGIRVVRSML